MNESFMFSMLTTATSGLATLFGVGLVVVGLVYVRRANAIAGFCMAGSGALGAFASVVRRLVGLFMSFGSGGMAILTISQVLTTLLTVVATVLLPVSIFLLANAVKQPPRQTW